MEKSYTAEEVMKHDKASDLWLTLDGGVYDMTEFLAQHPGGEEVLLKLAGQDGTDCFNEIGHSAEASQLRESYKIGRLEGPPYIAGTQAKDQEAKTEDDSVDVEAYEATPKTSNHAYISIFVGLAVITYAYIFLYVL